jgi:hypothetical protein
VDNRLTDDSMVVSLTHLADLSPRTIIILLLVLISVRV